MRKNTPRASQSATFIERRKRRVVLIAAAAIATILCWGYLISQASGAQALQITQIRVYGADEEIRPNLQAAAYRELEGSYLGLLSRANTYLYPARRVAAAVAAASPMVDRVSVSRDGRTALAVTVTLRAGTAIVCPGLPSFEVSEAGTDEDCYLAAEDGLILRPAKTGDSGLIKYYLPDLEVSDIAGDIILAEGGEYAALGRFVEGVRRIGIVPQSVLVKGAGEYELYSTNKRSGVSVIYFSAAAGLDSELANLADFWRSSAPGTEYEYIELRYGSNVFYRVIQ